MGLLKYRGFGAGMVHPNGHQGTRVAVLPLPHLTEHPLWTGMVLPTKGRVLASLVSISFQIFYHNCLIKSQVKWKPCRLFPPCWGWGPQHHPLLCTELLFSVPTREESTYRKKKEKKKNS